MIEVFKTNIIKRENAEGLIQKLSSDFPETRINFDLEDCDKILRIEGTQVHPEKVKDIVNNAGFVCEILD